MPSRKVLIIEDDPDQAAALRLHLESRGYTVVIASETSGAIPVAAREKPDVILLDLGLPGGGGMTVLARIRSTAETSGIPVIVISGSGLDPDWVFASGGQGYLEKPADADVVIRTIEKVLEPQGTVES